MDPDHRVIKGDHLVFGIIGKAFKLSTEYHIHLKIKFPCLFLNRKEPVTNKVLKLPLIIGWNVAVDLWLLTVKI